MRGGGEERGSAATLRPFPPRFLAVRVDDEARAGVPREQLERPLGVPHRYPRGGGGVADRDDEIAAADRPLDGGADLDGERPRRDHLSVDDLSQPRLAADRASTATTTSEGRRGG